ncbi:hypothetical protein [Streptomyces sp. bgisy060]|uniref:hypothetical protein n=1 Tax=Streptomyces sp. bgisy060 TaxID=3413775 RepID=UPI003EBF68E2
MLDTDTLTFGIRKLPKGHRAALLAAVDTGGRLPTGIRRNVLASLPEEWARTDPQTGHRWLTGAGRAVLLTVDRYRTLRDANPETGYVPLVNYAAGRGLSRDGLIVFRAPSGEPVDATDRWVTGVVPCITTRGRKLVGMPLVAPALTQRFPLRSRALWRRPGRPDETVQVDEWPMGDGLIRIWGPTGSYWPRREIPVSELRPQPTTDRHLELRSPATQSISAFRRRQDRHRA